MTTTTATSSTTAATTAATTTTQRDSASIGQSILSSLNATGSGINTDALVTELTDAQKAGLEAPITAKQTTNAAQISSAASIAADLTTFASSLQTLVTSGSLQSQPNSSDSGTVSVSAIAGTPIGAVSDTVVVSKLAQGQTLESQPLVTGTSYAADSGTLTIAIGTSSVSLTAGTDFTDLSTLTAAINRNASGLGVTASLATDGSGTHLVFKGKTGAAQAFTVSAAAPANGAASLTGFAYPPLDAAGNPATDTGDVATGTGMQRVQTAQDAAFSIDGVGYTRSSNSVTDAVPGVSMTLLKTGTIYLSSSRPTAAIGSAVSDFVSAYNLMLGDITTATAAPTSTSAAGPLQGNATLRGLKNQLARLTTMPLNASGSVRTLAEIGVSTAQDGTLSVDSTKLSAALAAYPDDVEAMFTTSQSSSSSAVLVSSVAGKVGSGVYTASGLSIGPPATGSLDGVAMTGSGSMLAAAAGSAADGLTLQLQAGAPATATITINQGVGGALQAVHDALLASNGALTSLQTSLTSQQTSLADALAKADAQVTVYHDQLVQQFTRMNTLVSGYKATQSYLTQQVDIWTNKNNN